MSGGAEISASGLVLVLLGGILLYAVMRRIRSAVTRASLGASRLKLVRRIRPVAEAILLVGYLVFAVPMVLRGSPAVTAAALGLMVLVLVLVTWFAIRDAVSGMFLKAGEFCQVGDVIEVEGLRGRVRGLGFRVLALETETGEEAFVPYSKISRQSLVRVPSSEGAHRHSFDIGRPEGVDPAELKAAVIRAALASHWSSVTRSPEVEVKASSCLVTVFSLHPDRAHEIEAEVRRALAGRHGEE